MAAMNEGPISIVLVDDHRVFNEGIRLLLEREQDLELRGTFTSAEEALDQWDDIAPDVVLMDIDLPGMDGVEAIRRVRELRSDAQVVVISGFQDSDTIARAMEAGAAAYLPKTHAADELVAAIRQASVGEITLPASYVGPVLTRLRERNERQSEARRLGDLLTPREREVLRSLADGRSIRDTAEALYLSVFTVRGHIRGILTKLGVGSVAQAVSLALRLGLVDF
jgi:DNA-binding NarL/FixJ family response regulator